MYCYFFHQNDGATEQRARTEPPAAVWTYFNILFQHWLWLIRGEPTNEYYEPGQDCPSGNSGICLMGQCWQWSVSHPAVSFSLLLLLLLLPSELNLHAAASAQRSVLHLQRIEENRWQHTYRSQNLIPSLTTCTACPCHQSQDRWSLLFWSTVYFFYYCIMLRLVVPQWSTSYLLLGYDKICSASVLYCIYITNICWDL